MLEDEPITREAGASIAEEIEQTFLSLAQSITKLRNILKFVCGGNAFHAFREFKQNFDYLYILTSDHPNMQDPEILKAITKWSSSREISIPYIQKGIVLAERYKSLLFSAGILKL